MKRDDAEAIFQLAGFKVSRVWELANMYWGGTEHTAKHYGGAPPTGHWWLLMTDVGPVRLGWRKRVIEIEWDATTVRAIVTADDVTKSDTLVHAWSVEKAIEYLKRLRQVAPPADPEVKS